MANTFIGIHDQNLNAKNSKSVPGRVYFNNNNNNITLNKKTHIRRMFLNN